MSCAAALACLQQPVAAAEQAALETDASCHGPVSATGTPLLDFFTGGGHYMPRTHCLQTAAGTSDWPWIALLLVLSAGVMVAYGRIFVLWMQFYYQERPEDRNPRLFDLAAIFVLCALCGYGLSMLMFVWPAYRLLAVFLLALNVFAWRFCFNARGFGAAFSAGRLERELNAALRTRANELEALVAQRTSQAERARREAWSLRQALDQHCLLSVADRSGRITDANTGFCQISGYSREELLGQDHRILNSGAHSRSFWVSVWRELAAGRAWRGKVCNRRKDGSLYWVDSVIVPHRGDDGQIDKYVSVRFDITAHKRAAEEIAEQQAKLAAFIKYAPASIAMFDRNMRYLAVSEAWRDEYELGDQPLVGRSHYDVFPNLPDRWRAVHEMALQGGVQRSDSDRWQPAPGAPEMHLRWEVRPWHDARGEIGGVLMFTQDIRGQIEREAELQRLRCLAEVASQTKSAFLANMSHEIRTPLTAILGYAQVLRDELGDGGADARCAQALDTIQSAGEHLLCVISDILDLSKVEAGKLSVEPVETPLPQLFADVDRLMRVRAGARGLGMHMRLDTPIPDRVITDPTRLRQVLMNIIGNATKFTEQGEISIAIAAESERLAVRVRDTGMGMTAAQVKLLFLPFSQADASITRRFGGTGLGLTISRHLAQLLGGDVSLESSEPGKGSTFLIEVALRPVEGSRVINELDAPVAAAACEKSSEVRLSGRILLAEDGPDNQRLISYILKKAGAQVEVAADGAIALQMLETAQRAGNPFDLLVSDMQMPEMDGYTLARTLRERGCDMPIVALTAHAVSEDRQRCLDAGCNDYAAKPIDKAALVRLCATWLTPGVRSQPDVVAQSA